MFMNTRHWEAAAGQRFGPRSLSSGLPLKNVNNNTWTDVVPLDLTASLVLKYTCEQINVSCACLSTSDSYHVLLCDVTLHVAVGVFILEELGEGGVLGVSI